MKAKIIKHHFIFHQPLYLKFYKSYLCLTLLLISSVTYAQTVTTTWSSGGVGYSTSGVTSTAGKYCSASGLQFSDQSNLQPYVQYDFPRGAKPSQASFRYDFDDYGGIIQFQQRLNGSWKSLNTVTLTDAKLCSPTTFINLSMNADAVRWIQTTPDQSDFVSLATDFQISYTPGIDTDGDGVFDDADFDDDNDGILDTVEGNADIDGDGILNRLDLDSDNDGINDVIEAGGSDPDGDGRPGSGAVIVNASGVPTAANGGLTPSDTDGDGVLNFLDLDSDNDGISDLQESGNPGISADTNKDGTVQNSESSVGSNGIPLALESGTEGGEVPVLTDADGDGVPNYIDTRSNGTTDDIDSTPFNTQDVDNDGRIDNATDADGDGIADVIDTNPGVFGGLSPLDPNEDTDGDGIKNVDEGGSTGIDTDEDGIPDYLDKDSDNDGIPDGVEKGATEMPVDTDVDGIPDFRDLDSDNDGINDVREGGGTSTDTDRDGRADGTIDPATGIPASAGPNGTIEPFDSDADGAPNFKDLDSDNDGLSDLIESGSPAAAGDIDNDGAIDIFVYSDGDNDGIMHNADGMPTIRGDSNDSDPTDTDEDGIPDYIDTRSYGTTDDIDTTPYSVQDADNDGKVDNATDADGDGIADVIDTKLGVFGGLPNTPDLTAVLAMSQPDFTGINTIRTFTLQIFNVSSVASSGTVRVFVVKPTPKFTITFEGNGWNSVDKGIFYELTNTGIVPANAGGSLAVTGTITKGSGVVKGTFNLSAVIEDNSGGELDNTNNSANIKLVVNP